MATIKRLLNLLMIVFLIIALGYCAIYFFGLFIEAWTTYFPK